MSQHLRLHWGIRVAVAYVVFAFSTVGFVAFAMTQTVELVSEDYYRLSLAEDARLEATRNADALGASLACRPSPDGRTLDIQLPPPHGEAGSGTVTFYRPSSAAADRTVPLGLDRTGRQRLPLSGLASGRWTLKLDWHVGARRYHHEQPLELP